MLFGFASRLSTRSSDRRRLLAGMTDCYKKDIIFRLKHLFLVMTRCAAPRARGRAMESLPRARAR
jgi:hypothetical protein